MPKPLEKKWSLARAIMKRIRFEQRLGMRARKYNKRCAYRVKDGKWLWGYKKHRKKGTRHVPKYVQRMNVLRSYRITG